MLLVQSLIISFLIISNFFFFSKKAHAQQFQFTIPDNSIQFKQAKQYKFKESSESNSKIIDDQIDIPVSISTDLIQTTNGNQSHLLKEHFDPSLIIEISDKYAIDLFQDFPPAISFEFRLESEANFVVFDEPIFYITLEGGEEPELIFARTIKEINEDWHRVILDLSSYDLVNKKLFFHLDNFANQEQQTNIYLKNLSSQVIVWHVGDQLFHQDRAINILDNDLKRVFISIANQEWPIYQFNKQEIQELISHQEIDDSLTLLFTHLEEVIFHNRRWFLSCDENFSQQLVQQNYYLLPQTQIKDFWPNLGNLVVLNTQDVVCEDVEQLILEVF